MGSLNSLPGKESSLIMSVNYSVQEIGFTSGATGFNDVKSKAE